MSSAIYTAAVAFVPIAMSTVLSVAVGMVVAVFAGVRYHEIAEEGKKMDTIVDNIAILGTNSNVVFVNNKMIPVGWVFGWHPFPYVGFAVFDKRDGGVTQRVSLWTTQSVFMSMMTTVGTAGTTVTVTGRAKALWNTLTGIVSTLTAVGLAGKVAEGAVPPPPPQSPPEARRELTTFVRDGNYHWLTYDSKSTNCTRFVPLPGAQAKAVAGIVELYRKRTAEGRGTCVFVQGLPGSGKTTLLKLCALATGGSMCKTLAPHEPGDTLEKLVRIAKPTAENPLWVLIDEVDGMIDKVQAGTIKADYKGLAIPISVFDKTTWVRFLDDVDSDMEHVVVILTTNVPKEVIDAKDPAYLRDGRVHGSFVV